MSNEAHSQSFDQSRLKLLASFLLPLSLFSLAAALAYFTYQAALISKQIPDVLLSINTTSEKIEPIIDELNLALKLVPDVLKEIEQTRKIIPPILKQVELTRNMIPSILKEVGQTRKLIPPILDESAAIRAELPATLSSADKASAAVADVAKQVEASRPLLADAIAEITTTREAIPPMMDRADVLIEKARIVGKEASEGAVTGLFTGIIKAPFALVAGAGRGITGMSESDAKNLGEKDFSLIEQASLYLLNNGSLDEQRKWNSTESDNHGIVKIADIYRSGEYSEVDCRSLEFKLYTKESLINETSRSFCKNDEGKWDVDE